MFSHTIFIYCKPPLTVVPLTISTFPLYSTPALVSCSVTRLLSPLPHAVAHCMLPLSPLEPPPKADMLGMLCCAFLLPPGTSSQKGSEDPRGRPSALWTPTASWPPGVVSTVPSPSRGASASPPALTSSVGWLQTVHTLLAAGVASPSAASQVVSWVEWGGRRGWRWWEGLAHMPTLQQRSRPKHACAHAEARQHRT
jgi:hypothetical protein